MSESLTRRLTSVLPRPTRMYIVLGAVLAGTLALLSCTGKDKEQKPEVIWVNDPDPELPQVDHLIYHSREMGHEVGVSVHLPADYNEQGREHAVLYFFHGVGGNEVSDIEGFMGYLQPLLQQFDLAEPIVVFPNAGMSQYQGKVEPMIVNELIPFIQQQYRTFGEAQKRVAVGFSMGGAGAIRLSIRNPQAFGGAVSWAGGMWHKDSALLQAAAENAQTLKANGFRALMINGQFDRPEVFKALESVFNEHAVDNQRVVLEGQEHEFSEYLHNSRELFAQFLRPVLTASAPAEAP